MGWSKANLWDTEEAHQIASDIAGVGLYCGPAVVGWIAAVWNRHKRRQYDVIARLKDKDLFEDGPRRFFGGWPGSGRTSLNALLKRETNDELELSSTTYYFYGQIHERLETFDNPIIIRSASWKDLDGGWHYVSLYKSYKKVRKCKTDKITFWWQDNGIYGEANNGNPGLYKTGERTLGWSLFLYGAKRVVRV